MLAKGLYFLNTRDVTASFEWSPKPSFHYLYELILTNYPLAQRNSV